MSFLWTIFNQNKMLKKVFKSEFTWVFSFISTYVVRGKVNNFVTFCYDSLAGSSDIFFVTINDHHHHHCRMSRMSASGCLSSCHSLDPFTWPNINTNKALHFLSINVCDHSGKRENFPSYCWYFLWTKSSSLQ